MTSQRQSDKDERDRLEEWSRQVRVTIRGIDGQAKRRTHRSHYNGITEDVIDGYELNTGLWHRLLGLLACCPASENAAAVPECGTNMLQVLPLSPQPPTVTTSTHGATPRTDAALLDAKLKYQFPNASFVHADFARQLERELAKAHAERIRNSAALHDMTKRAEACERDATTFRSARGALVACPHCGKSLPFDVSVGDHGIEATGYVPSTIQQRINLNGKQVEQLKQFAFGDETDPEEASDITIGWLPEHEDGPGWYVWLQEYPEEGSLPLTTFVSAIQERK